MSIPDADSARRDAAHNGVRIGLAVVGVVVVAATMRAGITCVGPLISVLRADTGLSSSQVGALNALPLLAFAAVAAVAPRIAREFGLERSLFGAVVVTLIGTVVRSLPTNAALSVAPLSSAVVSAAVTCCCQD